MSAAEMPTLDGVSGVPVMETSPASHCEQVVGFLLRIGSVFAVARDGAVHQLRMLSRQLFCAEAESSGRARGEILDEDVGPGHEAAQDLLGLVLPQIQGQ